MRCRHAEHLLSDHLEGLLPRRDESALSAHLARCPGCHRRREELRAVGADLRILAAITAPAGTELHAIERWSVEQETARRDLGTGPLRPAQPDLPETRWACRIGADRRRLAALAAAGLAGAVVAAVLVVGQRRDGHGSRAEMALARIPSRTAVEGLLPRLGSGGERSRERSARGRRLKTRQQQHEVRLRGLRSQSAKADFVPSLPRFQPTADPPAPEISRWHGRMLTPAPTGTTQARPQNRPGVRDDFVTVPLPRIAAGGPTADRAAAEAAAAYQREVAVVDPRLSRTVTLAQKATALSDLCEGLRADSGIQLAAGPSVADEKVTLFCEKLPLRDVMRQLSRPFGYTWVRSGKPGEYRYELVQDLRSQLLEEELRNRDHNAALLALDREMQRYRKYLGLSPDEAFARAKAAPPEEKKLLEHLGTDGWGLIQMYFRLSRRDLEALRAGRRLVFRQEPKPAQQPLPADLVRGVMESQRNRRILSREDGFHLGSAKENPDGLLPTAVPEVRAEITLRMPQSELGQFTLTGGPGLYIAEDRGFDLTGSAGDLAVGVSPTVLNPENAAANARLAHDPSLRPRVTVSPRPSCGSDLSPGPSPLRGGVPVPGSGLPQPAGAQRRDLSDTADKLPLPASGRRDGGAASWPRSGQRAGRGTTVVPVPGRALAAERTAAGAGPREGGEVNAPRVTTADVLEALHHASGIPIVADAYTQLYPVAELSTQNMTLFDALDRLADAMHLRWSKDGNWLQFRSTSYFNDRLKEVPNRLLARWAASRRQHGALTVEDLIEIGQLSDAQLDATAMAEGANECWGLAEWELVSRLPYLRPHLRYLAGFTPEQRRIAMSPEGLPFTRMTLAQQQQFLAFLLLPDVDRIASMEDLAGATLRVGYTLPGEFRWVLPGWHRFLPLVIRERTPEAALQAARRTDPQATEARIAPTRLDLAFLYTRASSPRFRAVCRDADGWTSGP
jgi:hypothetical protein